MPYRSARPCLAFASVTHYRASNGDGSTWPAAESFRFLRTLARADVRCAFPLAFAPNGPAALRARAMASRPVRVVRGI